MPKKGTKKYVIIKRQRKRRDAKEWIFKMIKSLHNNLKERKMKNRGKK